MCVRVCLVDDSSGVCVGWERSNVWVWVCMCVGVGGGELDGYMFSVVIICIVDFLSNPVCLFIINSLNAFHVAFTCCF